MIEIKCNNRGIDALKGVQSAVCGKKYIDLGNKEIIYFSYNNTVKEKCNFIKIFSNVQTVLKLWRFQKFVLK